MAESLCCLPETITTLLIVCTPIQNKKVFKKDVVQAVEMEGLQAPGTDFICHCTRSCQPSGKKDTKDFPHTWNFHTENGYILGNFSGNYSNDKRFYVAENDQNIEECLLN